MSKVTSSLSASSSFPDKAIADDSAPPPYCELDPMQKAMAIAHPTFAKLPMPMPSAPPDLALRREYEQSHAANCPICFQTFSFSDPIYRTDCQHEFCLSCISRTLQAADQCPLCRAEITSVRPVTTIKYPSTNTTSSASSASSASSSSSSSSSSYSSISSSDSAYNGVSSPAWILLRLKYNRVAYEIMYPIDSSSAFSYNHLVRFISSKLSLSLQCLKLVYQGKLLATFPSNLKTLLCKEPNLLLIAAFQDKQNAEKWNEKEEKSSSNKCAVQ